jgi:hypothetical protein
MCRATRIPVLDEKKLVEDPPDYALLLSWHIADELMPIRAAGASRAGSSCHCLGRACCDWSGRVGAVC